MQRIGRGILPSVSMHFAVPVFSLTAVIFLNPHSSFSFPLSRALFWYLVLCFFLWSVVRTSNSSPRNSRPVNPLYLSNMSSPKPRYAPFLRSALPHFHIRFEKALYSDTLLATSRCITLLPPNPRNVRRILRSNNLPTPKPVKPRGQIAEQEY